MKRAHVSAHSKEISRKKNQHETSSYPPSSGLRRLPDVEGLSSSSSRATPAWARQAALALPGLFQVRGKILQCRRPRLPGTMLANAECASIIQVIGAGSGPHFRYERYGKVIMTDADNEDPAHPHPAADPVLPLHAAHGRAGRIYAAVPPLHRIEVAGRDANARYSTPTPRTGCTRKLAALRRSGRTWKEPIQRYKGLGEMDADQLAELHDGPSPTARCVAITLAERGKPAPGGGRV